MHSKQRILHIDWDGPYKYSQLQELTDPKTARGVYQVYGYHPVYGKDVLLYIGKTGKQTFGKRLLQEDWISTNNYESNTFYIGRLAGGSTPSLETWLLEIELAEKLLIYSHKPAFNSMSLQVFRMSLCMMYTY